MFCALRIGRSAGIESFCAVTLLIGVVKRLAKLANLKSIQVEQSRVKLPKLSRRTVAKKRFGKRNDSETIAERGKCLPKRCQSEPRSEAILSRVCYLNRGRISQRNSPHVNFSSFTFGKLFPKQNFDLTTLSCIVAPSAADQVQSCINLSGC